MIIQHYFEPSIPAHIVRLCGKDAAGNDLGNDIELLIKSPPGNPAINLHAIEAMVGLLKGIDDFRVLETRNSAPGGVWRSNGIAAN